uniref:Uncharacterized protein n=1 Tax=Anguilla anguilla TaxID=7936 RepID=A0A0E9SJZ1_ANGAN
MTDLWPCGALNRKKPLSSVKKAHGCQWGPGPGAAPLDLGGGGAAEHRHRGFRFP